MTDPITVYNLDNVLPGTSTVRDLLTTDNRLENFGQLTRDELNDVKLQQDDRFRGLLTTLKALESRIKTLENKKDTK